MPPSVNTVTLRNTISGETYEQPIDGIFIAIGHAPSSELFAGQLEMNGGYLKVQSGTEGNATQTSIEGVFAAGDATTAPYKQIIIAMGSGANAALGAFDYMIRQ